MGLNRLVQDSAARRRLRSSALARKVAVFSGTVSTLAPSPTDFCNTPALPAPVPPPIPYPNVALPVTGILGTTKTFITVTPVLSKKGRILVSNGDQPGVVVGIKSGTIMRPAAMTMTSTDVTREFEDEVPWVVVQVA